jgi:hypothetical protein
MNDAAVKQNIRNAIQQFDKRDLTTASLELFNTLGYNTERQSPLDKPIREAFKESFIGPDSKFNDEKALYEDWEYIDLLFQLSNEELNFEKTLFKKEVITKLPDGKEDRTIMETYLFFAIELNKYQYSRTELSRITREVNRLFPMPVMILFKTSGSLTLSVINRRVDKRDDSKDVLKKVTLIKDIRIENPHRAHIEILFDLTFSELLAEHKFSNFVDLHKAWQKTLDTKELNNRFFKELSNWYFWAKNKKVSFPDDIENNEEIRNATNLIRLITRVIFIWFIKEKSLVPEAFFNKAELKKILKEFYTNKSSSTYYKAILQNLFFGTLNQKMDERYFAREDGYPHNVNEYGVKNLFRYADLFNLTEKEALALFKDIPFLNGGLFDCLDKPNDEGKILYVDGFSRNSKKQANVPDFLFFADEHETDLNKDYGTKNKKHKVKGLIEILSGYKFTITENTPVEEEVALDPELLGRVFENLLASYNPETQNTARKQTGSFYTPREIVNYMVDESLKAYLKQKLVENADMKEEDTEIALKFLFEYNEKEHLFEKEQTEVLIQAIDTCKILDPACGSGAFPMGILHKLVHILDKIDPNNEQWKDRQIEKAKQIDDIDIRDKLIKDIEEAFACNELDYGRKLYLIENCIFGVDIQPIAVQIAKLRFFISLVVDQKKQIGKENFGIRALPNLETKFVAANTLIGLDKPKQFLIQNPEIKKLENTLKDLRHKYFSAKTRKDKLYCQKKDKDLRGKIATFLIKDGWDNKSAEQVAAFDPYDQNTFSPFFDPEWMFGIKDGFNVIIGNPPYVRADNPAIAEQRDIILNSKQYITLWEKWDLMVPFFERGLKMLELSGILTFIVSNAITTSKYAEKLQDWIIKNHFVRSIDYFENIEVFEAGVIPVVLSLQAQRKETYTKKIYRTNLFDNVEVIMLDNDTENLKSKVFRKSFSDIFKPNISAERLGDVCYMSKGMVTNSDEKTAQGEFVKDDLISDIRDEIHCKEYVEGKNIEAYHIDKIRFIEYNTYRVPNKLSRPTFRDLYKGDKILRGRVTKGTFDNTGIVCNDSIVVLKRFCDLKNINERSISVSISKNNFEKHGSKTSAQVNKRRTELERISENYTLKYILAILNSSYAMAYLNNYRRHRLKNYFYPDDFRNYPIPKKSLPEQLVLSKIVTIILFAKNKGKDSKLLESLINFMVYELYFPNKIKSAGCEVLKYLTNLSEFKGDWSEEKKLKKIESVYKELSDPAHPVSIAIEKMKTIPEVQIIEGRH